MSIFYESTKDKIFSYKPYQKELIAALENDNSYMYLQRNTKIPTFSFPLPNIDYDLVVKECHTLLEKYKDNFLYTNINGHQNLKNWKIYFIYKDLTTDHRDAAQAKFNEENFSFLYKDEFPELEKLITKYNWPSSPVFISVLEPGGIIPEHRDKVDKKDYMSKSRLPISYPENCKMLLENVGSLDYYSKELVLFNHRLMHGVYNYSDKPKVDISISGYAYDPDDFNAFDNAIKNKIKGILSAL